MQLERFGFIRNSRAGEGANAEAIDHAIDLVRKAGHGAESYECPSDPAEPVGRALKSGCTVVVACGGDGTVSGVAGAVYGSGAALGVLPLGTLNHFAADLGVKEIEIAQQVLVAGHRRTVDAAMVNGKLFINNSGIGLYPAVVVERESIRKHGIPKWPALAIGFVRTMARIRLLRLRLEADGKKLNGRTPFLFVGNNAYQLEGRSLGTRKRLDEGRLVVWAAQRAGRMRLLYIGLRALFGRLRGEKDFVAIETSRLTIRTKRPKRLHVSLDGEVHRMRTPLEYSILPGALQVLGP